LGCSHRVGSGCNKSETFRFLLSLTVKLSVTESSGMVFILIEIGFTSASPTENVFL